ncbi:hypothetical protein Slin15195_G120900 [Septoria linicola]|uniref:Uncharacterized protein n=1 Tax=Septoria linicola TaxID=215465 RepID=A0A9Q9EPH3_9PEZI|nr:hypothetical protein Slin15195_G120900 [Septoria linicola]
MTASPVPQKGHEPAPTASLVALTLALSDSQHSSNNIFKRDDGDLDCYTLLNIIDYNVDCPTANYPTDDKGRNMMTRLFFALAATTIPDDTTYGPEENIIRTVPRETGEITATIGAGVGGGVASANGAVEFDFAAPNNGDKSICMFTEGAGGDPKNSSDIITLKRARELLETLITRPNQNCETCGRIPIRYPEESDGGSGRGGILKLNVRAANNCTGKGVGPNSLATATPTPSTSAGMSLRTADGLPGLGIFLFSLTMAWLFGVAMFRRVACANV